MEVLSCNYIWLVSRFVSHCACVLVFLYVISAHFCHFQSLIDRVEGKECGVLSAECWMNLNCWVWSAQKVYEFGLAGPLVNVGPPTPWAPVSVNRGSTCTYYSVFAKVFCRPRHGHHPPRINEREGSFVHDMRIIFHSSFQCFKLALKCEGHIRIQFQLAQYLTNYIRCLFLPDGANVCVRVCVCNASRWYR